jgi:hypothetical protein
MSLTKSEKEKVSRTVASLFTNGNTPMKLFGIDAELIRRVEVENPHITKQYPMC